MNRSSLRIHAALLAAASLACDSQPALAKEIDRGKLAADSDKLVGLCGAHDAKIWVTPDGNNWGCGYKGGGGIFCDKDGGCTETTPEREVPWGLAGLLGLIGLLGLTTRRRREPDPLR
jgi:MYXO-CTERM domain-containing protein